jgi:5-formyltetrahydrofolate cyclo-ligase
VSDHSTGEKATLRRKMRLLRREIPPEERSRLTRQIEDRLLGLTEVRTALTVLLFYSFGSEVTTKDMADQLMGDGKRLLLPYLTPQGMEAAEVRPGEALLPTNYGPREPSRRIPLDPGEVDVVATPGLAFDRRGFRLGYGGGYYDRYLTRLRPETIRIGLGFSVQMVEHIPEEPSDQKVHLVVTDAEVIDCRAEPDPSTGPSISGPPL